MTGQGPHARSAYTHAPMKFLSRFVDSNDRELRRIQPWVDEANALEAEFEALTAEQIRAQFAEIREEIRARSPQPEEPSEDELHHEDLERRRELTKARRKRENERLQKALDDVLPEVFAMTREAMKRTLEHAPLRRPAHRRRGPPPGPDRRDADRRGQDARRAAGRDPQLADRPRRPHRDRQRLPGPARPAVDGPDLPLPRRQRRDDHRTTPRTSSNPATRRPTSG